MPPLQPSLEKYFEIQNKKNSYEKEFAETLDATEGNGLQDVVQTQIFKKEEEIANLKNSNRQNASNREVEVKQLLVERQNQTDNHKEQQEFTINRREQKHLVQYRMEQQQQYAQNRLEEVHNENRKKVQQQQTTNRKEQEHQQRHEQPINRDLSQHPQQQRIFKQSQQQQNKEYQQKNQRQQQQQQQQHNQMPNSPKEYSSQYQTQQTTRQQVPQFQEKARQFQEQDQPRYPQRDEQSSLSDQYERNDQQERLERQQRNGKQQLLKTNDTPKPSLPEKTMKVSHPLKKTIKICPFEGKSINAKVMDNSLLHEGVIGCIAAADFPKLMDIQNTITKLDLGNEPYTPVLNEFIIAQFEELWYRAKVIGKATNNAFFVSYIDFTNESTVLPEHIRSYPADLDDECYTMLCVIQDLPEDITEQQLEQLKDVLPAFSDLHIDVAEVTDEQVVAIKSKQLLANLENKVTS